MSSLERALIAASAWLVYLAAGAFILYTGRGVPPDNKYIFGGATLIVGLVSWICFRANYGRLAGMPLKRAVTWAAAALLAALLLSALYASLLDYCVISDPRGFTIYYPLWNAGELAKGVEEKGNRHRLTADYGEGSLNKLITGMPGYPLPIIVTTFALLALLEGVFVSVTSAAAVLLARVPARAPGTAEGGSPGAGEGERIRILFLAANPQDTDPLRLDREFRAIDENIRQSEYRDRFDLRQQWAVRVTDLQGYLLHHRPSILHFSGHGSPSSEIILEAEDGGSRPVSPRSLGRLFSILGGNLSCVVLNACYSEQQAKAIARNVNYVVGMSKEISDPAAISFAAAFYRAIGYGESIETAFNLACNQIDLQSLDEQDTPKLIARLQSPDS